MPTLQPSLWEQLTPEQRERIIAILVQMLLGQATAAEVARDSE